MKGNRPLDELLMAYITEELNTTQRALTEQWIREDSNVKKRLEELRQAWELLAINRQLDKIDVNLEWKRFEQAVSKKEQKLTVVKAPVPEAASREDIQADGAPNPRRWLFSAAVAASVLLCLLLGWMFNAKQKSGHNAVITALPAKPAAEVLHREVNKSSKPRSIQLPDGSRMILYANSEITYGAFLTKRDIMLHGTADFKVVKDKTKPFTVYSPYVATTAVGTYFTVLANKGALHTTVKLMDGKVVVRPIKDARSYYLLPGQKLVYNNSSSMATVSEIRKKKSAAETVLAEAPADLPQLPKKDGSWYMFNNQSLGQVFQQLSLLYHVDIVYDKKEVANLYFIGTYNKTDSVETVLRQIAGINNLKVAKQKDEYIISR